MRPGLLLLGFVLLPSIACTTGVAQSSTASLPTAYNGQTIADVVAAAATPLPTRIPASPMNTTLEPAPAAPVEAPAADLRAMALGVEDFPAGYQLVRELVMPNADFANLSGDPTRVFELLEGSGRAAGFVNIFSRTAASGMGAFLVTGSIHRYRDAAKIGEAWTAYEEVSLQYPPLPYLKTEQLEAQKLGDQSGMMRLSLTDPTGQKLVLHWTYFRHGPIIADVTTVAGEAQSDSGELSAALAKKLFERISARPQ